MFGVRWKVKKASAMGAVVHDQMSPNRLKDIMKGKPKDEPKDDESEGKGDEDEDEPIFKNTINRFMVEYAEMHQKVQDAVKLAELIAAGKEPEKVVKIASTGRIQFEGIVIEEEPVPLLLCDNCEVRYSVIFCRDCREGGEVQCLRCCELCHPIPPSEHKHVHEIATSQRVAAIRPIQEGDVSKVVVEKPFPIPNYYIEESDAAIAKGVDLTIPNTLATNYTDPAAFVQPQKMPYKNLPRYAVDDKLLFTDPLSKQPAYGRVISEWDQRHGPVAPSIIRGEGTLYMYVVEMIDLVANIGTLADLMKFLSQKEPDPEYPVFKDIENVPYRWEFAAAREVNRKVREMHELQTLGPRRHFRTSQDRKTLIEEEPDGRDDVSHAQQSQVTFERNDELFFSDEQSMLPPLADANKLDKPEPEQRSETEKRAEALLAIRHVELTKDEQLDRLREQLPGAIVPTSPRAASKRSFFHAVQVDNPAAKDEEPKPTSPSKASGAAYMGVSRIKSTNTEPLKIIDPIKASKVFLLKENELSRPEDVFNMEELINAKSSVSRKEMYLTRVLNNLKRKFKFLAFNLWHSQMEFLSFRRRNVSSMRIQKYVRRWLQRNTLQQLIDEWQIICREKWLTLHNQFNYCERETPYSVTMDHKLYFKTKLDANRYANFLRVTCMKLLKLFSRKRNKLVVFFFKLWHSNCDAFDESAIKYGHFDMSTADIDAGQPDDTGEVGDYGWGPTGGMTRLSHPHPTEDNSISAAQQKEAQELYTAFRKLGRRAVSDDDSNYVNVSTIPLGLTRKPVIPPPEPTAEEIAAKQAKKNLKGYFEVEEKEEPFDMEGVLPPYRPDLSIKLPAAIPVYMPSNAKDRLEVSNQRRLTYCSYKAHMEGPCEDACWIIPGRIAMGCIPWGRAHKRTQTSSITSLLLGGCDVFVSCMEELEEQDCEKRLNIQPISKMLKKAAAGARMAVDEVARNSRRVCEDMERKLKNIPVLEPTHADYEPMKKEMTRCKARVKLATEAKTRAQSEFERLPKVFEWIRVPLKSDECPTLQQILPVLWQLERKLSEGRSLYIYSREGHGRCGLLAGCLLGRLYSFNPTETLIRIQNSHDCAKREEGRAVPITCPQLQAHRNLITQVINHTNRPMMGIVYRSHSDPETKQDILNMPKKGTGLGLPYKDTPKVLQTVSTAPFANVTPKDMDTGIMVRKKESVMFDIKLERDVKPSYVTVHGRGDDVVNIPSIYEMHTNPKRLGQNANVVRETELQRQPEAGIDKKQIKMPVLRIKNTAL